MSVSSHLTPEPERRLWLIWESMRHAVEATELRAGALTAFAAAELALFAVLTPFGPLAWATFAPLYVALPLGVLALAPLSRLARKPAARPDSAEILLEPAALAAHSHNELVHRLDSYLGGGITATQYYEDLVGQILAQARSAVLKRRLLEALCWLVGAGQLAVVAQLLRR